MDKTLDDAFEYGGKRLAKVRAAESVEKWQRVKQKLAEVNHRGEVKGLRRGLPVTPELQRRIASICGIPGTVRVAKRDNLGCQSTLEELAEEIGRKQFEVMAAKLQLDPSDALDVDPRKTRLLSVPKIWQKTTSLIKERTKIFMKDALTLKGGFRLALDLGPYSYKVYNAFSQETSTLTRAAALTYIVPGVNCVTEHEARKAKNEGSPPDFVVCVFADTLLFTPLFPLGIALHFGRFAAQLLRGDWIDVDLMDPQVIHSNRSNGWYSYYTKTEEYFRSRDFQEQIQMQFTAELAQLGAAASMTIGTLTTVQALKMTIAETDDERREIRTIMDPLAHRVWNDMCGQIPMKKARFLNETSATWMRWMENEMVQFDDEFFPAYMAKMKKRQDQRLQNAIQGWTSLRSSTELEKAYADNLARNLKAKLNKELEAASGLLDKERAEFKLEFPYTTRKVIENMLVFVPDEIKTMCESIEEDKLDCRQDPSKHWNEEKQLCEPDCGTGHPPKHLDDQPGATECYKGDSPLFIDCDEEFRNSTQKDVGIARKLWSGQIRCRGVENCRAEGFWSDGSRLQKLVRGEFRCKLGGKMEAVGLTDTYLEHCKLEADQSVHLCTVEATVSLGEQDMKLARESGIGEADVARLIEQAKVR
ncbi:putative heat-labile enterotoxin [Ophiocordyceps camponoti-floridani]|uniref:Putative heat-labile enterotoxin n=1 Tax=Ophiocordyceps camponoti-floridani TaxID=2030778 RepID=A0A8H4VGT9_9HYPO|nr:putative heat-labile enterotoxin [Ophiocordyceps camponoti-floridani]